MLSAQFRLYPLRHSDPALIIARALEMFEQRKLKASSGAMSSVVSGGSRDVFPALQQAFLTAAIQRDADMVTPFSNTYPTAEAAESRGVSFQPIGVVWHPFSEPADPDRLKD
ncbi:MAG: YkoF family thiamine/hydroxymethylpyrimidine-binding protein [Anaerolineales bacterium]|jgi:hypothetical protein